jgi:hypothetical protein
MKRAPAGRASVARWVGRDAAGNRLLMTRVVNDFGDLHEVNAGCGPVQTSYQFPHLIGEETFCSRPGVISRPEEPEAHRCAGGRSRCRGSRVHTLVIFVVEGPGWSLTSWWRYAVADSRLRQVKRSWAASRDRDRPEGRKVADDGRDHPIARMVPTSYVLLGYWVSVCQLASSDALSARAKMAARSISPVSFWPPPWSAPIRRVPPWHPSTPGVDSVVPATREPSR